MNAKNIKAKSKPSKEVDYSNIFTLENIIKIPVDAVVDANINASKASFNFIKEFGFESSDDPKTPNKLGKPKMLTFTYRFNNAGVEQKMRVNIPILSLITLPYLNIRRAKFDVGLNILNNVKIEEKGKTKKETLVLLGPLEDKKKETDTETRVETNMQASIEVETSDFPAGILQMLNLFKDATSGSAKDVYALDAKENAITFSQKKKKKSIMVRLLNNGEPAPFQTISANISSNTDLDLCDTFLKPITIKKGTTIGIPSLGAATALTDENGIATFTFTSLYAKNKKERKHNNKPKPEKPEKQNGFIYFSNPRASKIAIYYNLI